MKKVTLTLPEEDLAGIKLLLDLAVEELETRLGEDGSDGAPTWARRASGSWLQAVKELTSPKQLQQPRAPRKVTGDERRADMLSTVIREITARPKRYEWGYTAFCPLCKVVVQQCPKVAIDAGSEGAKVSESQGDER